jgi:hypothetical protein
MTRRTIAWIGLTLYAGSFFLVAVDEPDQMFGWTCAYFALSIPLTTPLGSPVFGGNPFLYLAMLVSGWINVVFLIALIVHASHWRARMFVLLRASVLLMVPFCWPVFYYERLRFPREAHFVWIIGMLLALFSEELWRLVGQQPASASKTAPLNATKSALS